MRAASSTWARAIGLSACLGGCASPQAPMAPISPVTFGGRDPGSLDLNLDAAGSSTMYGQGQVVVEPWFGWQASAPVSVAVTTTGAETHAIGRAGARYRIVEAVLVGGGLGPALIKTAGSDVWGPYFDVELGWGKTTNKKQRMIATRPGVTVFPERIGLSVPLTFSQGIRLGRWITLSFSPFAAFRMMFPRESAPPSVVRTWAVDGGVTLSITGHIPRRKLRARPRILFDM